MCFDMPRWNHLLGQWDHHSWLEEIKYPTFQNTAMEITYANFAVDTPSYRLDLRYWYHWNVQVVSNVTVQVPFVYVAWFSRYSCFSCFYGGLVHGNTVLRLSWNPWIKNNCISCLSDHWVSNPLNVHFSAVRSSGVNLRFRSITDYLCGLFLRVWVSDYWWCPSTDRFLYIIVLRPQYQ